MRILIAGVTYYPAPNGQARATVNLAEGLAGLGHDVLMVMQSDREYAYSDQRHGIQIRGLQSINLKVLHPDAYFSLFPSKSVRKIIDEFHPDIVHIQDHYPITRSVVLAAHKRGIKVVGTDHFLPENLAPYLPGYSWLKPFYNWILWHWMLEVFNRLDAVTAPSKTAVDLLRAKGLRVPVFPLSGGINLDRFYPDPNVNPKICRQRYGLATDRTIFLYVGRVDGEKRLDVILYALHRLERDDIQFCIAGHGAASGKLKKLAQELDLGRRVYFTGFVPNEDLPGLINSCDVFVMPSDAELLSLASLEAMACGLPMLAANAVALPELVTNGVNGYLFQPGDDADAERCMEKLAGHPELWYGMGAASLERARQHGLDSILRRNEALYEMVLSGSVATESEIPLPSMQRKNKTKESRSSPSA
jgi:1,2-diacylglycerol 3-alpha-glucosyltransferase